MPIASSDAVYETLVSSDQPVKKGLKLVALIEGTKGVLALIAAFGLHELAGGNIHRSVESLVQRLHLNPASHYSGVVVGELSAISYSNLTLVAMGAFAYAVVRFIEAYGLWHELAWVEWFALLSSALYIPFEVFELIVNPGVLSVIVIAVNSVIVGYLATVVRAKQ